MNEKLRVGTITAIFAMVAVAWTTALFAGDSKSAEMEAIEIVGEVVAVDTDKMMVSLKNVRQDVEPHSVNVKEIDVPDKMVIYFDDETHIMDDGERVALGQIFEGDLLHVKYKNKEDKSWAESMEKRNKK
jgi:hypothetical protein